MNAVALAVVAEACGARLAGPAGGREVRGVTQDTRRLRAGDLYVALRGARFDGHEFAGVAAAGGASAAMVAEDAAERVLREAPDLPLVIVPDTLAGLQRLAAWWRGHLELTAVCVTGSSGKTSTRAFLAAVLGVLGRVAATKGNYNNHIGVPLTILGAGREDRFGVWEVAMNHPGEIAPLAALARPDIGVITNIGTAHIEFFEDRSGIAAEKGELFRGTRADGLCFYPGFDDFAGTLEALAGPERARPVWLDRGIPRAERVRQEGAGMVFDLVAEGGRFEVRLPAPGMHMVSNALLAAAVGLACGLDGKRVAEALGAAELEGGRMQVVEIGGRKVLDDTYNANPESMIAALRTLAGWGEGVRRVAVLGKMGELGHYAEEGCRRVGVAAAGCVDLLVAVGAEAREIARSAREAGLVGSHEVETVEEAAEIVSGGTAPGDVVLVKGSRSARMERVVALLKGRFGEEERGG